MPTRVYQLSQPCSLLYITTGYLRSGMLLFELPFDVDFGYRKRAAVMSRERLARKLQRYKVSEKHNEALHHAVLCLRNEAEQEELL